MNKRRRIFFIIQIVCLIGWIIALIIERLHYFEGYPTNRSNFYGWFRILFVIVSFITTLIYYLEKKQNGNA